ncbi:Uncharacterised protein [Ewingella americana]|uniref:Uncharacterized protein n=1 Tax=Ewingella americana TaxID=41202 RepID=A0A377ND74_9GAMM|nr:Uncharacterised protein [Ewingella americana]
MLKTLVTRISAAALLVASVSAYAAEPLRVAADPFRTLKFWRM